MVEEDENKEDKLNEKKDDKSNGNKSQAIISICIESEESEKFFNSNSLFSYENYENEKGEGIKQK